MVLLESILYAIHVLAIVFAACEFGQRLSDAFDEINDIINQFNWYLFPIEIRKILPNFMINTQQPVVMKCFGCISCSRKQFKKVNLLNF